MDYRDLDEALGYPGTAAVAARERTVSAMAFADSKMSEAITEEESGKKKENCAGSLRHRD
jgi:hypothetical protein